jgi:hypothetical protein
MFYIVEMECSYHLGPWGETEKEQWNAGWLWSRKSFILGLFFSNLNRCKCVDEGMFVSL